MEWPSSFVTQTIFQVFTNHMKTVLLNNTDIHLLYYLFTYISDWPTVICCVFYFGVFVYWFDCLEQNFSMLS